MIVVAAVLVVATLVVMTAGWVRPVVALGAAIVIAGLLGIAPARELFAGLSNGGVITVGAMLVIAKGVVQTGVVARVTRIGRTSVTVGVDMYAEDVASGERQLATSGSFVFVAIDDEGHPTPID